MLATKTKPGPSPRPLHERFWAYVDKTGPVPARTTGIRSRCWLWTASTAGKGYGKLRIGSQSDGTRREEYVHRLAYELEVGPVPVGWEIDHLCRVKQCVRPSHLEAVEPVENMFRTRRKRCRRGHVLNDSTVYITPSTGHRSCLRCRRIYEGHRNERRKQARRAH